MTMTSEAERAAEATRKAIARITKSKRRQKSAKVRFLGSVFPSDTWEEWETPKEIFLDPKDKKNWRKGRWIER